MKIQQEHLPFRPITLKLEKHSEAEALLGLMDKICNCIASVGCEITPATITEHEKQLAIAISNAFTDRKVSI